MWVKVQLSSRLMDRSVSMATCVGLPLPVGDLNPFSLATRRVTEVVDDSISPWMFQILWIRIPPFWMNTRSRRSAGALRGSFYLKKLSEHSFWKAVWESKQLLGRLGCYKSDSKFKISDRLKSPAWIDLKWIIKTCFTASKQIDGLSWQATSVIFLFTLKLPASFMANKQDCFIFEQVLVGLHKYQFDKIKKCFRLSKQMFFVVIVVFVF